MKPIETAVRCTREEYMDHVVKSGKHSVLPAVLGAIVTVLGVVLWLVAGTADQLTVLLLFAGVLLLLTDPLIVPTVRKGAAAKTYDHSDSLQGAVAVRIDENELSVKTVTVEATLPLSAVTEVQESPQAMALCFGRELTVCLPKRAFHEEDIIALTAMLAQIRK